MTGPDKIVERGGGERTRGEASGGEQRSNQSGEVTLQPTRKMYAIVINFNQYQLIVIRYVAFVVGKDSKASLQYYNNCPDELDLVGWYLPTINAINIIIPIVFCAPTLGTYFKFAPM